VRSKRVIRHKGTGDQIRSLRMHTFVNVSAVVAIRPAVETVIADCGHIVRHQIAAEPVTLINGRPQHRLGMLPKREPIGVTQPGRVTPMCAGAHVNFPDLRRPSSAAKPFSPTLLFEPMPT